MSQNVENKVVEFQFNNSNFEKNVKTSMSTLDKLKKALNFGDAEKSFKSLDRATKNFDMSSMDKSIDGLGQKFSALQTIAVGALLKIGDQAVVAGEQLIKSLTVDQIAAGFDKYSQKVQAVATIMSATGLSMEEIEKHLEGLNTYTDRTSYGFSQMVDNVGKFTSAGVELEDAVKAMEGIGNWASLSGVTAASGKAAIAMYNLSQAMGQGYLLMQDWRSIENVNMATREFKETLIETGLAMGELKQGSDGLIYTLKGTEVNANNLRNSLADRWVNKEVMLSTLKRYSDETDQLGQKAYKAAAEARTFEDAIGAVNDAISTSWMKTHEMIFGDYEEATKFWTGIQDYVLGIFDKTMSARNKLFSGTLQNNAWQQLKDLFEGLNHEETTFEEQVIKMAKNHGIAIDEMIDAEGSLFEVSKQGVFTADLMSDVFGDFAASLIREAASLDISSEAWTDRDRVIKQVMNGELGFGDELRRNLNALGYGNAEIDEANRRLNDIRYGIGWITDAQWEALGYTAEEVKQLKHMSEELDRSDSSATKLVNDLTRRGGRELIIESLYNMLDALVLVIEKVKAAWNDIFPQVTAEKLYNLIERFHKFTEGLILNNQSADKLRRTFRGLFAVVDILAEVFRGAFRVGASIVNAVMGKMNGSILDTTASIGDALTGFRNWVKQNEVISGAFDKIAELAGHATEKIVEFVDSVIHSDEVTGIIGFFSDQFEKMTTNISEFVKNHGGLVGIFDSIVGYLKTGYELAKNWITNIFSGLDFNDIWSNIKLFFDNIWDAIKSFFTKENLDKIKKTGGSFEKLKEVFRGFKDGANDAFNAVATALGNLKNTFSTWFEKIKTDTEGFTSWIVTAINNVKKYLIDNIPGLIPLGIGAGVFASIFGIVKLVIQFFKLIRPISDFIDSLAKLNKAKAFALRLSAIGDMFKAIGLTILMVAGSLKLIDSLKNPEASLGILAGILIGIGIIVGILGLLSKKFSAIQEKLDLNGLAMTVAAVAAGIFVVSLSLKMLETLDPDKLGQTLLAFVVVIGSMIGAYWAFTKLGKGQDAKLSKGALFALAFAGAVKIIASAMKTIAKMTVGDIMKGLFVIGLLSIVIGALAKIASSSSWGGAMMMVGIAAGFWLLGQAIKSFKDVDFTAMGKFFIAFLPMLFAIFTALAATKLAGENALGAAATMAAIGIAIYLMAKSMEIMSKVDADRFASIATAIGIFMAEFAGIIWTTKFAGKEAMKAAVTVMAVAMACVILAGAMWLIAKIPEDRLLGSALVIGELLVLLGGIIWATKFSGEAKLGPIIAAVVAIAVLAGALIAISLIADPNQVLAASEALSMVMLSFGIMNLLLGETKKLGKDAVGQLYAMLPIVLVLGAIITAMSQFKMESDVIQNAFAIGLLLNSLAAAMWILSNMKNSISWKTIGQLAVMEALAVGAGLIIVALDKIGPSAVASIEYALAIGLLLNSLALAMLILSQIGTFGGASWSALGAIGAVIGVFDVITVIMGYMDQWTGGTFSTAVDKGLELMIKLSTGLGEAIGGFIGGIFDEALSHLPSIAESISTFVEKLKTALTGVNQSMLDAASTLAGVVLVFTVAEFVDALASFFSGGQSNLDKFGGELETFGTHLATFYENTEGIDNVYRFKVLAEATEYLGKFASSLPSTMPTKESIESFGSGIEAFARHMRAFGTNAKNVDLDIVMQGADAAQKLADFANSLVKKGGILQELAGETISLSTFGSQMEDFAESLVVFGDKLKDFDGDDVEKIELAAQAGGKLNELAGSLQDSGGFIGKIFGEKDLSNFGKQVKDFGYNLKFFVQSIEGLTDEDVTNTETAAAVAGPLVDMCRKLNTTDNWWDIFTKDTDLGTFGEHIKAFGKALVEYSTELRGLDGEAVNNAGPAITGLVNISRYLSDSAQFSTSVNTIAYLADEIMRFNSALNEAVSGGLEDKIQTFLTALDGFKINTEDLVPTSAEQSSITSAIETLFESIIQIAKDACDDFKDIGEEMATQLGTGIENKTQYIVLVMSALANDGTDAAKAQYMDFWETGVFLAKGFIAGVNSMSTPVYDAGYNMAKSTEAGIRSASVMYSPSRVAYQLGEFYGKGYINALNDASDKVYDAAYFMGDNANFGLESAISHMEDIINGEIDSNPVITPVLDLSEIQNGVTSLDGVFYGRQYSILGDISAASYNRANYIRVADRSLIPGGVTNNSNSQTSITNNNSFNITSSDPKQAAEEIDVILQRKISRRENVWA